MDFDLRSVGAKRSIPVFASVIGPVTDANTGIDRFAPTDRKSKSIRRGVCESSSRICRIVSTSGETNIGCEPTWLAALTFKVTQSARVTLVTQCRTDAKARRLAFELNGARAYVRTWYFIYHASAPAKCLMATRTQ